MSDKILLGECSICGWKVPDDLARRIRPGERISTLVSIMAAHFAEHQIAANNP